MEKQKLVCLTSGTSSGSTMVEIITATRDGRLPRTEVVGVISSKHDSKSLKRAFDLGIPYLDSFEPDRYPESESLGSDLLRSLRTMRSDIIGQYGWDVQTPEITLQSLDKITWINQHPGPVDPSDYDFGGLYMSCAPRVHAARLLFVRFTDRNYWTDVISQRVATKFDDGAVFKRGRVPILPDDDVASLQKRAILTEWQVQIQALRDLEIGFLRELPPYNDLIRIHERVTLQVAKTIARGMYTKDGDLKRSPDLHRILQDIPGDQQEISYIGRMMVQSFFERIQAS